MNKYNVFIPLTIKNSLVTLCNCIQQAEGGESNKYPSACHFISLPVHLYVHFSVSVNILISAIMRTTDSPYGMKVSPLPEQMKVITKIGCHVLRQRKLLFSFLKRFVSEVLKRTLF